MPSSLYVAKFQPVASDGSPLAVAPSAARVQAIVERAFAAAASGQDAALADAPPIEALAGRIVAAVLALDAAPPPQAGPALQAPARPARGRLTPQEVRDAIREIGPFTVADLAGRLGVSHGHARVLIKRHAERGMIRRDGSQLVGRGRPRHMWVFQKPAEARTVPAPKPVPARGRRPGAGSQPVAGTAKPGAGRKDTGRLLAAARRHGCQVSRGGKHFKVRTPSGQLVVVAAAPSDHRALANARADLRRSGVRV